MLLKPPHICRLFFWDFQIFSVLVLLQPTIHPDATILYFMLKVTVNVMDFLVFTQGYALKLRNLNVMCSHKQHNVLLANAFIGMKGTKPSQTKPKQQTAEIFIKPLAQIQFQAIRFHTYYYYICSLPYHNHIHTYFETLSGLTHLNQRPEHHQHPSLLNKITMHWEVFVGWIVNRLSSFSYELSSLKLNVKIPRIKLLYIVSATRST